MQEEAVKRGRPPKEKSDDRILNVGFAKLHDDLFLNGKNFNKQLDGFRLPAVKMQYNLDEKELWVTWGNKTARIVSTNIAYYIEGAPEDRKIVQAGHAQVLGASVSAQVETPMSHVHAGLGHGKTR